MVFGFKRNCTFVIQLLSVAIVGATFLLPCCGSGMATAGPLAVDVNAFNDGVNPTWQGTRSFSALMMGMSFQADVDFAVYAPGVFSLSFPGQDPSGGTDFVYAYQIFNTGVMGQGGIGLLSVGITGLDELPANPGFFGAGQAPNSASFAEAVPPFSSVRFSYTSPAPANFLPVGTNSNFLIFTSPFGPEFDNSSLQDSQALVNQQLLPSPVPEPSALVLLGIGACALLFYRTRRCC